MRDTSCVKPDQSKRFTGEKSAAGRFVRAVGTVCFAVLLASCEEQAVQCDVDGAHLLLQSGQEEAVTLDYTANYTDGEVVAPAAIVTVDGIGQDLALKVGAEAGAWDEISKQVEANASPIASLAYSVESAVTYASVVEVISEGPVEFPATCTATVTHADQSMSSGDMACSVLIAYVMDPPVKDCGTFDCHSHWGIGVTTCHCNTANCCPAGEVCNCGPGGAQLCHRTTFCSCS